MAYDPRIVTALAEECGLKVWPSFVERVCCDAKEVYLNGGWRGSKSVTAAFRRFVRIYFKWLRTPLPVDDKGRAIGTHLIWLAGPDYEQARPEYFYIQRWAQRMGIQAEASSAINGSLRMIITRKDHPGVVEVVTKSANDPTSLGSFAPVEIIGCECGQFSGEAAEWLRGRATEKNAPIDWAGTFHNDQGKAQFAWYEEESAAVKEHPTPRKQAFNLPSWENDFLFGNCLEGDELSILADPTLGEWCPDDNHGPAHSGLNHPMMRLRQNEYKDKPREWDKRYGGIPVGVLNPVYEWASIKPEHYLKPMPANLKKLRSAGGMDFGTVHPSAITLGSVMENGETWVWKSIKDTSGSLDWIWATKAALTRQYGIRLWGADPMVKYNPTFLDAQAMSGSLYAREARVGIVNGVQQDDKLFFDSNDAGVQVLFREMQRVHRRRNANGQVAYVREEDDMTASFEDMMAMLHGQPYARISNRTTLRRRAAPRELVTARSIS